jgi:SAM-dependent methyltransferase
MTDDGGAVDLRCPPGRTDLPRFDRGWDAGDRRVEPFLSYVDSDQPVNWSSRLEAMHEESSRSHFIDVWTRRAILARLGSLHAGSVVVDLGCSTGYLLEDIRTAQPGVTLVGVDLVSAGLRKAHVNVPEARLVQADARALPLEDSSVDAVVSANLLEHVADDRRALAELCRVLRPGARAVLVAPAGPRLYDYYDRFLGHERRYARGELSGKAGGAGLEVLEDVYLGALLYPAFWLVKQRNRRRYDDLRGPALEARVAADIARTRDSRAGRLVCRLEESLLGRGIRLPFGIREQIVVRRPPVSR